jgi:hypothetical protein
MIKVNVWDGGSWKKGHYGHSSLTLKTYHKDQDTEFDPTAQGLHYVSFWPGENAPNSINKNNAEMTVRQATRSFNEDCEAEWNFDDVGKEAKKTKKPISIQEQRNQNRKLFFNEPDAFNQIEEFKDFTFFRQNLEEKPDRNKSQRLPEGVFELPDIGGEGYGLDFVAIYNWWYYFRTNDGFKYNKFNSNCSTVAIMGLYKAGARNFYSDLPWRGAIVMRQPADVRKYASKLKENMDFIKVGVDWIKRAPEPNSYVKDRVFPDRMLMPTDYWTELTKVKNFIGFTSNRYGLLKNIDAAIVHYNNLDKTSTKESGMLGYRCVRLSVILMLIGKIITKRPNTQRANAYRILGYKCLKMIESMKNEKINGKAAGYWEHLGRDADRLHDELPKDLRAVAADSYHEDE